MGVGKMSTPEKEYPAGLDNVSYIYFFLEYLYNILDGRFNGRSQHPADRPIHWFRRGAYILIVYFSLICGLFRVS